MSYHYTELGNVPVVVQYTFQPQAKMYDADDGTYDIIPPYVFIEQVYINGYTTKGLHCFSEWQLDKWEDEILAVHTA